MAGGSKRVAAGATVSITLLVALAAGLATAAAARADGVVCGQLVTRSVELRHDLDCDGNGLTIGRDGITIDLAGHTITSRGDYAIGNVDGHSDVRVLDGNLVSYTGVGVVLEGAHRNHIAGIQVTGDADWAFALHGGARNYLGRDGGDFLEGGIDVVNSDHNRITGAALTRIAFGAVVLGHSNGNILRRSELDGDGPISLSNSNRNVFARNSNATNPGFFGVQLSDSNANRFLHNTFYAGSTAIWLRDADSRNVIRWNTLAGDELSLHASASSRNRIGHNNGVGGFLLRSSRRDEVRGNVVSNGVDTDIAIQDSAREIVEGNQVSDAISVSSPYGDGIAVASDSRLIRVLDNVARGNADDGIEVDSPAATIAGNTADDNGDLGIEAVNGVTDGGGNHASGNGNPLQCTGVLCS